MLTLTTEQTNAASEFTAFMLNPDERHMIIGGWAGCGKSTLTKHLIKKLYDEEKMYRLLVGGNDELEVIVTATTNKAARVIGDVTGQESKTIHSLLGLKVKKDFRTGKVNLLKTNNYQIYSHIVLIVDEASFADQYLLDAIIEASPNCKVLFIMDPYQLAPVNEKTPPVWDMPIRKAMLSDVVRQGVGNGNNPIAQLSAGFREAVKTGVFPKIVPDGKYIHYVDGPTFQQMVDAEFGKTTSDNDHAKILAWTNKRVQEYNQHVRSLRGYPNHFTVGERVVANNPIFMGSNIYKSTDTIVEVTAVHGDSTVEGVDGSHITVNNASFTWFSPHDYNDVKALYDRLAKKKEWATLFSLQESWLDIRPIHACTCHKAQGSTYKKVFIDLNDIGRCTDSDEVARMLYVACSRASEEVIFYGRLPTRYGG